MDENQTPVGGAEDVEAHGSYARVTEDDTEAHLEPLRREVDSSDAETTTPGFRAPAGTEDDAEAHMPWGSASRGRREH